MQAIVVILPAGEVLLVGVIAPIKQNMRINHAAKHMVAPGHQTHLHHILIVSQVGLKLKMVQECQMLQCLFQLLVL